MIKKERKKLIGIYCIEYKKHMTGSCGYIIYDVKTKKCAVGFSNVVLAQHVLENAKTLKELRCITPIEKIKKSHTMHFRNLSV